jgi:glutaredoxin 3
MLELFGTATCPYTAELREDLEYRNRDFVEYDIERDADARSRVRELCGDGPAAVPLLVDDGRVVQVGYGGRSCYVSVETGATT